MERIPFCCVGNIVTERLQNGRKIGKVRGGCAGSVADRNNLHAVLKFVESVCMRERDGVEW
jgi:hypothetical protein